MTTILQSHALYPDDGIAYIKRRQTNYLAPVGDPWPQVEVGQQVEIHDLHGWIWDATIQSIDLDPAKPGDEQGTVRIIGEKRPSPMPPIKDGFLRLPNINGHAHCRYWRRRRSQIRVDGQLHGVTPHR